MQQSSGAHDVVIGLIDGPIAIDHPELAAGNIHLAGGCLKILHPGRCDRMFSVPGD